MPRASDKKIDAVICGNLKRFAKPGVVSVRPGLLISKGKITDQPAIVVGVRKKLRNLPPAAMLPPKVGDIPVDVRPLSTIEALRATNPDAFARRLANIPRGNVPIELQTPNFPLERNLN